MRVLLFACCLLLFNAPLTSADLKPPTKPQDDDKISRPAPSEGGKYILHTGLEITTDPKAYEAKLQISQSQLQTFRAAGVVGSSGPFPVVDGFESGAPRTIIAGLLMFLAVSVAGVLLARSSSRTPKAIAAIVIVVVVLGAAAIITRGNAGPPGSYRWRNLPQALAKGESTTGGVDVEVVPDDQLSGRMRLIIPLKKQNAPGEE